MVTTHPKVVSTFSFSPESQEVLREAANAEVLCITRTNEFKEFLIHLQEAEVLCAYSLPDNVRELAPTLRWLQYPGAGVDSLQPTGLLAADSGIIVTTASGIHATNISEYVLGSIGRRIAQLGRAFGMTVLGMRRSATPGEQDPDVDQLYTLEQLQELLSRSDYVVLATPLTPATEKMIGEPELRAMRPNAYLVNIARGRIIDEAVLIRALKEGWIAGAGLDVTEKEPLPADSPLYSMANVILTPHISGASDNYDKRLTALFAENLRRYCAGQPLLNQYDPQRGY